MSLHVLWQFLLTRGFSLRKNGRLEDMGLGNEEIQDFCTYLEGFKPGCHN